MAVLTLDFVKQKWPNISRGSVTSNYQTVETSYWSSETLDSISLHSSSSLQDSSEKRTLDQ